MSSANTWPRFEMDEVVIDTYHGIEVADPFRWLEEHRSVRTQSWISGQAEATRKYLDALPGRGSLSRRVTELLDQQAISEMSKSGDLVYYIMRQPGEEQPKLYRRKGIDGVNTLLLDPASLGEGTSLSFAILGLSPDGNLLALGLRTGGEGARRIRILDLRSGQLLPDILPKGAIRSFAFLPESNGFFYVLEDVGNRSVPKTAKLHILGHLVENDEIVFSAGQASNIRLISGFNPKSSVAVHTIIRALGGRNLTSVYLQKLPVRGEAPTALLLDSPYACEVSTNEQHLFALLDKGEGGGRRLLRVSLGISDLARASTVLFEGRQPIQKWRVLGDRILTITVENLSSCFRLYSLDGKPLGVIDLPSSGTANLLWGDQDGCFFSFENYSHPREVHYFDFTTGTRTLFSDPHETRTHIAARCVQYCADDQTVIPLTLLGRPEILEDGNAPILLTAYGAAGMSLTPQYSFLATCLVELGAIFAIAHVRGGGELGLAWEEAGTRQNRPNVHKDFIAAAEFLISNGIANPQVIAIAGGSSSGLLVTTAMTQRPDLFRAVVCVAPFTDMLRYQLRDNTQFYVPQFGSSDNPDDFPILLSISPYHNVHEGVPYPALLMISGDSDTRCDPLHARKFVARLQAAMSHLPREILEERPALLDWNPLRGHFATLSFTTRTEAIVDRLAFLCHHLEMEVK